MIPKVIHYCWFGGKEKPKLVKECIKSWKNLMPDYEIKEWNEENFNIKINSFVEQAYFNKKWAFVADYCRLWVLYNHGGIYLDTDMEVLKRLDVFLQDNSFGGVEDNHIINVAIWGAKKGDKFIKTILEYYEKLEYCKDEEQLWEITIPLIVTKLAKEYGYQSLDEIQTLRDGTRIYPKEYFYPKSQSWEKEILTEKTYTIHHYEGSWRSKGKILRTKTKQVLINIFGYETINSIQSKFNRIRDK